MAFQIVDPLGNTFTHLASDLPLPAGTTAPGRGATSVELDTGRVLRYHQPNQTWYVLSGPTFTGSVLSTYGAANAGYNPTTGLVEDFVSDYTAHATLDEIRMYLKVIAVGIAELGNKSLDELIDDTFDSA